MKPINKKMINKIAVNIQMNVGRMLKLRILEARNGATRQMRCSKRCDL